MKKHLAKILVLVLIISLLVPAGVSAAAGDAYDVSVTLTNGTGKWEKTFEKQSGSLQTFIGTVAAAVAAQDKSQFAGTGLSATLADLLAAAQGDNAAAWTSWLGSVEGLSEAQVTTLSDRTADLDTVAAQGPYTGTFSGVTLTVTFTASVEEQQTTPVVIPTNPESTDAEPAAEESTAEVTEEDIKEADGEPIVLDIEEVEPAKDADEADTIIDINIPENQENVKVLIPVTEVTDTTVVYIVKTNEDGTTTKEVLPKTAMTEEGLVIEVDGDVSIIVVEEEVAYTDTEDLTEEEQAAIEFVTARGLVEGYGGGVYAPDDTLNRYMFATIRYRLESKPDTDTESITFGDVESDKWFSEGVAWAAEKGIVVGYGDGEYGGDDPVTIEQIAVMLWRYCGKPEAEAVETSAHDWAADAMSWAVANGLFAADVDAQGAATRLDIAMVLKTFINMQQGADMVATEEEVTPEAAE